VLEYVKSSFNKKKKFWKTQSMYHLLPALRQEKSSIYSILMFVILDARDRDHNQEGAKGAMARQMFRKYCHFVLWEAFS